MHVRQGTTVSVADRHEPGTAAVLPGQNMTAEQALIAEARARARRRRQKIALALTAAAAVLSAAGVLITMTVPGEPHKVDTIAPAGPAIRTGTVTGFLPACDGLELRPGQSPPVEPGWVTVVRGTVNSRQSYIRASGPVVALAYMSNNHQVFRFSLPPGKYVVIGRWGETPYVPGTYTYLHTQVSVIAGKTLHAYLPVLCH